MTAPLEKNNEVELHIEVPLYRGKSKRRDEHLHGYLLVDEGVFQICPVNEDGTLALHLAAEVHKETLAIHHSNMVDKHKTKVFASLNSKGIGGDTLVNTIVLDIVDNKEAAVERSTKWPLIFTSNGVYSGMVSHLQKITNFDEYIVSGIYSE